MNSPFEKMLLNRFDMSQWRTGFVDNYSHMCVAVSKNILELTQFSPRGLVEWRDPMTDQLCTANIEQVGHSGRFYPIYVNETNFLPWSVHQQGFFQAEGSNYISSQAKLFSPNYNTLIWSFVIESDNKDNCEYRIVLTGNMRFPEKKHRMKPCSSGLICLFYSQKTCSKYLAFPQSDGILPIWSIRSKSVRAVTIDTDNCTYKMELEPFKLEQGKKYEFTVQIDYETVPVNSTDTWVPGGMYEFQSADEEISVRKKQWMDALGGKNHGQGDAVKKLRSEAGLIRNGFVWNHGESGKSMIANYCSVTSWSSAAFFWDSIISSAGLMYFNIPLAQDAIKAIYLLQRDDGCVPTCSYEHVEGSTLYPQAPITAWALLHMLKYGAEKEFIKEIVPKIDKLHQWFMNTQDHDRDGLPEWRFSGCPADNSPLYDHYALPTNRNLGEMWNIYLPPIASVSLSSYLIMESKCLAYLYEMLGDSKQSQYYLDHAQKMEKALVEICFENGEMFYDYDHHTRRYNRALTLYSFLPLWAGVKIDPTVKKNMIENILLNEEYFFGEYPFPYLAYNEEAYKPDGYWRGRVWPHTTLWMLELLWSNGYCQQADQAADRLIKMMNQREEILENYNSDPHFPGGGEMDYSWSYASYLMIENREYRKPVLDIVNQRFC